MHFISFVLFVTFISISSALELEQYRALREQCARTPPPKECLELKSKFLQILDKCQQINTRKQAILCQQVKDKLCAVFPTTCAQAKSSTTTKSTSTTPKKQIKPKPKVTTAKTEGTTMSNEEFIQVSVNPEDLRTRGEYCIRHGKEKKCQQLLNNLKNTYSTCNKKKPSTTKPQPIDCHSFQTHLCKAFPTFPPCIKKTNNL